MAFANYQETTNSATNTPSTSHNPSYPSTVNEDDILVMALMSNADNTFSGWPAGWVLLGSSNGSPGHIEVRAKIATGDESGTFALTSTNVQAAAFSIRRYSAGPTALVAATDYAIAAGAWVATAAPDPPAVTADWGAADNTFVAIGGGRGDNAVATAAPANYGNLETSASTNGGGGGAEVWTADRQYSATDTDNPGAFTIDESEDTYAFTLVIAEAVASITPARAKVIPKATTPTVSLDANAVPERAGVRMDSRVASIFQPPPLEFPIAPLPLRAELFIDGTWTDVSDRFHSQDLAPARGRADEASETEPSSLQFALDNADGWLTPGNANSPWWPHIDQGILFRLSIRAGPTALCLPGASTAYASSPDHADFDVTDLDLRIRVEPDVWSKGVTWSGLSRVVTDFQRLVSKWDAGADQRSFNLMTWGPGHPAVEWSIDGTQGGQVFRTGFSTIAGLHPIWVAATVDTDAGGGSYVATVYVNEAEVPDPDVTTWTKIEEVSAVASSIHAGTADLLIGAIAAGSGPLAGRVLEMELRDAINGALVANPVFTSIDAGTTSFQDATGKSWTIFGAAEISNWRTRFVGSVDELVPDWPHGDNEPSYSPIDLIDETYGDPGFRPSEARVAMTANGILRRLGQGQDPLRSSLWRHITSDRSRDRLIAYWPCEDVEGAVRLGPGLTTHSAMTFAGGQAGTDDELAASAPLPVVSDGDVATFVGTVPAGSASEWAVDWVFRIPTAVASPAFTRVITVKSQGDVAEWRLELNDTAVRLEGYDVAGVQVFSSSTSSDPALFGDWVLARVGATQSGIDIDWGWELTPLDLGATYLGSATLTATTLGAVSAIDNVVTGPPDGYTFGHIVISDGSLPVGWLAGADTAWVGESAAHRFWRLCTEAGIPVEVVGDANASGGADAGLRGDLDLSEAMGPQERKTLVELLHECAAIDLGVIIERRSNPGLIYRTRKTIENQTVRLALDAAAANAGDIGHGLEPRSDDQRVRNDITVSSIAGSSERAVDQASIDARGRYTDAPDLNGVGGVPIQSAIIVTQSGLADAIDSQNLYQAEWRLNLGTWPGLRYPTIIVPLAVAVAQIGDWLDLELGDRVQLVNLPAQHPDVIIDLLIEQAIENITPSLWSPELTCSPAGPWIVGELQ